MNVTEITNVKVHPAVRDLAHEKQVSHLEAEDLLRGRAGREAAAKAVVDAIDKERADDRAAVTARNAAMAKLLGQGGKVDVAALVQALLDNPEAETWLTRRVNLARAHGRLPADDEHHDNRG